MADQVKKALRDTMKQIRFKISDSYRTTASSQVCTRIRLLDQYRHAKQIALYFAVNGDPAILRFIAHAMLESIFNKRDQYQRRNIPVAGVADHIERDIEPIAVTDLFQFDIVLNMCELFLQSDLIFLGIV